ncbi:MAG: hypothetical protein CSB34_00405 [Desulfobulbus propionicus]|nr:MAG: hypothetical protein CSB34_00405 [Desulfobulbus propionicus]
MYAILVNGQVVSNGEDKESDLFFGVGHTYAFCSKNMDKKPHSCDFRKRITYTSSPAQKIVLIP